MDTNNAKVVLTGSASGIGYFLMQKLLERGAEVVACDINEIDYEDDKLHKITLDLSESSGVDKLITYAVEKLNNIDLFIANAGFAYYEKIKSADWEHIARIYRMNVFSAIYAAVKMKEFKGAEAFSCVITASAMGFYSLPGYALYSSTKAALRGFADGYRFELDKGQHLILAYPIATKTKFFNAASRMPVAWPAQEPSLVAERIIKGIIKDKKSVYPSRIFRVFKAVASIIPIAVKGYTASANRAYKKWLKEKQ